MLIKDLQIYGYWLVGVTKHPFLVGMVDVLQCILGFKTKRDLGCMSLSQLLFA
jgi:hypothetical protein